MIREDHRGRRDALARQIEELRVDVEHWNSLHPGEEIDADAILAGPARLLAEVDALLARRGVA